MLPSLYYWEERVKQAKSDSDSGPGKRNSERHGTE